MLRLVKTCAMAAGVAALAVSATVVPATAQTKWNLPAAYPADNPHSVNLIAFAKDVGDATGGKLQITVHAGGVAVQGAGNQARGRNRPGAGGRGSDLAA